MVDNLKKHGQDTGSSAVQVAGLTQDIARLTVHFNRNKKDVGCRRTILKKVALRKRLLAYLKRKNVEDYKQVLEVLNLKK